jgi:hypothetical protein
MQLDRVRRHAGLSVLEIEEGDTDDARVRAKPQLRPRRASAGGDKASLHAHTTTKATE